MPHNRKSAARMNYNNAPIMRFVMNDVLYTFRCVRKEDGLL